MVKGRKKLREKFEKPSLKTRHSNINLRRSLGRKSVGDESIKWSDLENTAASLSSTTEGSTHLTFNSRIENTNIQDDPLWFQHLGLEHSCVVQPTEWIPPRESVPNVLPEDSVVASPLKTQGHLKHIAKFVNKSVVVSHGQFQKAKAKEKGKVIQGLILANESNSSESVDDGLLPPVRKKGKKIFSRRQADTSRQQEEKDKLYQALFADESDSALHTSKLSKRGKDGKRGTRRSLRKSSANEVPKQFDLTTDSDDETSPEVKNSRSLRNMRQNAILPETRTKGRHPISRLRGKRTNEDAGGTSRYKRIFEESDSSDSSVKDHGSQENIRQIDAKVSEKSIRKSTMSASVRSRGNISSSPVHSHDSSREVESSRNNISRALRSMRSKTKTPSNEETYDRTLNARTSPKSPFRAQKKVGVVETSPHEGDLEHEESGDTFGSLTKRKNPFSRYRAKRTSKDAGSTSRYKRIFEESDSSDSSVKDHGSQENIRQIDAKVSEKSIRKSTMSASVRSQGKISSSPVHSHDSSREVESSRNIISRALRSMRSKTKTPSNEETYDRTLNARTSPKSPFRAQQKVGVVETSPHEERITFGGDLEHDESRDVLETHTKRKHPLSQLRGGKINEREGSTSRYKGVFEDSDTSDSSPTVEEEHEGDSRNESKSRKRSAQPTFKVNQALDEEHVDEDSVFNPVVESTRLDFSTSTQSPRSQTKHASNKLNQNTPSKSVAKSYRTTVVEQAVPLSLEKRKSIHNSGRLGTTPSQGLRVELHKKIMQNKPDESESSNESSSTKILLKNQLGLPSPGRTVSGTNLNITIPTPTVPSNSKMLRIQDCSVPSASKLFGGPAKSFSSGSTQSISLTAAQSDETETMPVSRVRKQIQSSKFVSQSTENTQEGQKEAQSVRNTSTREMSIANVNLQVKDVSKQTSVVDVRTRGSTSSSGNSKRLYFNSSSGTQKLTPSDTPSSFKGMSNREKSLAHQSKTEHIDQLNTSSVRPRSNYTSESENDVSETSTMSSSESSSLLATNAPSEQIISSGKTPESVWTDNPLHDVQNDALNDEESESRGSADSEESEVVFSVDESDDFVNLPEPIEEPERSFQRIGSRELPLSSSNKQRIASGSKSPSKQHSAGKSHVESKQVKKLTNEDIQRMQVGLKSWLAEERAKQSNQPNDRIAVTEKELFKKPVKPAPKQKKKAEPLFFNEDGTPYRKPRRTRPKPYVTPKMYKFLITKLTKKYGLSSDIKAQEFVTYLCQTVSSTIRRTKRYHEGVEDLLKEMVKLELVNTRFQFYLFIEDFLPMEFRQKAIPSTRNEYGPEPVDDVHADLSKKKKK